MHSECTASNIVGLFSMAELVYTFGIWSEISIYLKVRKRVQSSAGTKNRPIISYTDYKNMFKINTLKSRNL